MRRISLYINISLALNQSYPYLTNKEKKRLSKILAPIEELNLLNQSVRRKMLDRDVVFSRLVFFKTSLKNDKT